MTRARRLQVQSLVVFVLAGVTLATPRTAAATEVTGCGVCFTSSDCSWTPPEGAGTACQYYCASSKPSSECTSPVPAGWTCSGNSGGNNSFVQCY